MDQSMFLKLIEEMIPFNKFLGMQVVHMSPGKLRIDIPFREELIGNPMRRALHGGVLSTVSDTAGGMLIWSALDHIWYNLSTIDLRMDYLRPGKCETLACEATLVRLGKSVGVADMRCFHPGNEEETIATGKGVYSIKVMKQIPAGFEGAAKDLKDPKLPKDKSA